MYSKIAINNVKKSFKDYTIYFLTIAFAVCIFYSFNSIESQKALLDMNKNQAEYMSLVTGDMGEDTLVYSMKTLTALLEKYYEKKVIVLIDEYDVPLAKANENGYYDQMVLLVRNLFENVLKTNSSLKF